MRHITFTPSADANEHISSNAVRRPKFFWHPGRYAHFGPIHLHDWAEWFVLGTPIEIVGRGPLLGHIWRFESTEHRHEKLFEPATPIPIDMCEDCWASYLSRVQALNDEMHASCDHERV